METLQLLAVALGLATFAGLNLYLTVLVTGLAIRFHWVALAPQYQPLDVLAHPAILITAGILYAIEFLADKIPWIDTIWDSIHTIIRPVGGALLALRLLGSTNPVIDVLVALLAGGATLFTHGTKAGTRLVANGFPEPFSNILLSLAGDLIVLGGLALLHFNPVIALAVILLIFAVIGYYVPKLARGGRTILWLAWKKLNAPPAGGTSPGDLPCSLPTWCTHFLDRLDLTSEKIEWVVPCISGVSKQFPANLSGWLVATDGEPLKLYFVGKSRTTKPGVELVLENCTASCESKFLSENLVLDSPEKKGSHSFLFPRSETALAQRVADQITTRQKAVEKL